MTKSTENLDTYELNTEGLSDEQIVLKKKLFAQAQNIWEKLQRENNHIFDSALRYLPPCYFVVDKKLFYDNCAELDKLGKEYTKAFNLNKAPRIFISPPLHENYNNVVVYVNTAYSKKIHNFDEYVEQEIESKKKNDTPDAEEDLYNFIKTFEEIRNKYNPKYIIFRNPSHDYRGKLRNNEVEIKRVYLRKRGTFFAGISPKFFITPPKKKRIDLYENKENVFKINYNTYVSDAQDKSNL